MALTSHLVIHAPLFWSMVGDFQNTSWCAGGRSPAARTMVIGSVLGGAMVHGRHPFEIYVLAQYGWRHESKTVAS